MSDRATGGPGSSHPHDRSIPAGSTRISRGELRVLLGAAPGVGKTCAMLREGHRLRSEGRDLVIGYLETHGRAETAAEAEGLEALPRGQVTYLGKVMEEMDLEAILRRHPEIVLVDELAHTNVPGSRHQKRWQDVEAIRDAGIDVITTMNVQHITELVDIVTGIVGVPIRETVPDRVLDGATEIQLIDLPIDVLVERLEQGKIYSADRSRQALEHFFRKGNLNALRELALRRTAAGLDDRLADMMMDGGDGAVVAADRVMVLLDPDPRWGGVLRTAWRLANAVQSEIDVVILAPHGDIDELPETERIMVRQHAQLGEDLGAIVSIIDDRGQRGEEREALIDVLRQQRITMLVVGVDVVPGRWGRGARLRGLDLIATVMLALPLVDVYAVRM